MELSSPRITMLPSGILPEGPKVVLQLNHYLFIFFSRSSTLWNNDKMYSIVNTKPSNSCSLLSSSICSEPNCMCYTFVWLTTQVVCSHPRHHKHVRSIQRYYTVMATTSVGHHLLGPTLYMRPIIELSLGSSQPYITVECSNDLSTR